MEKLEHHSTHFPYVSQFIKVMWTISISKQKTTTRRTKASFPIYFGVYLMYISFIIGLTSFLPPNFLRTKIKRKRGA